MSGSKYRDGEHAPPMVWCSGTSDSFGRSLPIETVHLWLVKRLILVLSFLDSPKVLFNSRATHQSTTKNLINKIHTQKLLMYLLSLGTPKAAPFRILYGKSIMQVTLVTFKCWRSQQIAISRIAFQESHRRTSGPVPTH